MTTITTVTAKIFLAWRTDFPALKINHSLFAVSPHLLIAQYRFYYFYPDPHNISNLEGYKIISSVRVVVIHFMSVPCVLSFRFLTSFPAAKTDR